MCLVFKYFSIKYLVFSILVLSKKYNITIYICYIVFFTLIMYFDKYISSNIYKSSISPRKIHNS